MYISIGFYIRLCLLSSFFGDIINSIWNFPLQKAFMYMVSIFRGCYTVILYRSSIINFLAYLTLGWRAPSNIIYSIFNLTIRNRYIKFSSQLTSIRIRYSILHSLSFIKIISALTSATRVILINLLYGSKVSFRHFIIKQVVTVAHIFSIYRSYRNWYNAS